MSDHSSNQEEVRTTTHVYRKRDLLGTGSSCEVFIGTQKGTGEEHALKIFKDALWARSEERRREVSALRRLQHPNIIKYYGEEEEAGSGRILLVLELCTEGSLHTYLHEPRNSRGLDDEEFLLLIRHLSSALRYLHHKNYVHRDIKPGNILRHIDYDGSCTYKLSDFGASRLNEEGDLFMSLAGTEEYLHPAVYEKAFVDRGAVVCFDSSVDLWSVGCTLYQAVTCQIPFRPHGGVRTNRTVMFQMIAQKDTGVIAGYQLTDKSPIIWEKHIPNTCKLTQSLKADIRNLISRLLEKDRALLMSHDQFYEHVQTVLRMVPVVIFNTEEAAYLTIYIKPNCSFAEFQDHVAGKTDVMAGDQLLFYRGRMMFDLLVDGATVDFLSCDQREPIILISKSESDCEIKEPQIFGPPPSFQLTSSIEKDCHMAHKMAVLLCDIHERISTFVSLQDSTEKTCGCMAFHHEKLETYLERTYMTLSTRLPEARSRLDLMQEMEMQRVKVTNESNSSISYRCKQARIVIPKIQDGLREVKLQLLSCKDVSSKFISPRSSSFKCSRKCVIKAENLCKKGRDIWRKMYSWKKMRLMSELQHLCHTRERTVMEDLVTSALSLYDGHCMPNWKRTLDNFKTCLDSFHALEKALNEVKKKLSHLQSELDDLEGVMIQIGAFCGKAWQDVSEQMATLQKGLKSVKGEGQHTVMEEAQDSKAKIFNTDFQHQLWDNG